MCAGLTDPEIFAPLASFTAPGPVAHGLTPLAYTDDGFQELENQRLFPRSWTFVGFAHELAKPGDAVPLTLAGRPLLLVRGRDRKIRAFHNVCRHRCLKLVEEPGNVGPVITCPYHTWVYGLDGKLRATPYFGGPDRQQPEGFDPVEHGLKAVRCAVWHDWIFVNLSADAPAFEDFARPLTERLEGIDFTRLRPVASLDFGEVRCNWKLLMENFIEPYHVQFVHRTTTQQPLLDHFTIVDGPCLGSAVDLDKELQGQEPDGNSLAVSSRYLTLFPNFVLGRYFPDQIGVHLNLPKGVDRTHQRRVIYLTEDRAPAPGEAEGLSDLWTKVHEEDHAMCVRLQAGRASEAACDGGVLSPHWENSVRRFQELVAAAVQ